MKKCFAYTVLIAFIGATLLSAKGEETGEFEQGKAIYQDKCQLCHGEQGEGNGPLASSFIDPPSNFTKPGFWDENPEQKIMNAIEKGYKLMPPINLTPNQITKIMDYMSHTFKK